MSCGEPCPASSPLLRGGSSSRGSCTQRDSAPAISSCVEVALYPAAQPFEVHFAVKLLVELGAALSLKHLRDRAVVLDEVRDHCLDVIDVPTFGVIELACLVHELNLVVKQHQHHSSQAHVRAPEQSENPVRCKPRRPRSA